MASEAAKAIEAILMVAQEPVDPHLLAQVLEVAPARVSELCAELQASYEAEDRGYSTLVLTDHLDLSGAHVTRLAWLPAMASAA